MLNQSGKFIGNKLLQHRASAVVIFVLFALLFFLWFSYVNFYQPINDLAAIYTLKGNVKFSTLNINLLNEVYSSIQTKIQRPAAPLDNVSSPF